VGQSGKYYGVQIPSLYRFPPVRSPSLAPFLITRSGGQGDMVMIGRHTTVAVLIASSAHTCTTLLGGLCLGGFEMNTRSYHLVELIQGLSSHSNGKFCGVIFNKSGPLRGICSLPSPRRFFSLKNLAVGLSRTDFEGNSQLKSADRNFIIFFLVEGSPVPLTAITKPAAQRRRFFGPSSHLYLGVGVCGPMFLFSS